MNLKTDTLWLHRKTGGLYRLVDICTIEADLSKAVLYRREDGSGPVWCRPVSEFCDGRFVEVTMDWSQMLAAVLKPFVASVDRAMLTDPSLGDAAEVHLFGVPLGDIRKAVAMLEGFAAHRKREQELAATAADSPKS